MESISSGHMIKTLDFEKIDPRVKMSENWGKNLRNERYKNDGRYSKITKMSEKYYNLTF